MNINGLSTGTSTWRKDSFTVKGNDIYEHSFMNTTPNIYFVQNTGASAVLIGISSLPTLTSYEKKCNKNDSITFGRPFGSNKLYFLNTTSTDTTITVYSFEDTFDPTINKNTLINIENAEVTTDGIIKGFQAGVSLPSGTNSIGKVDMGTQFESDMNELLTLMSTNGGKLDTIDNTLSTGVIIDTTTPLNVHTDIADKLTVVEGEFTSVEVVEDTITVSTPYSYTCNKIVYFVNDSVNDISLTINSKVITVKSGEVLNDIKWSFTTFTVAPKTGGQTVSFRFLGGIQ